MEDLDHTQGKVAWLAPNLDEVPRVPVRLSARESCLLVVVIHHYESGPGDNDWWCGWDSMTEMMYFRDDPVPFYVRILGPPDIDVPEVNRHNYLKVERDDRRRRLAEHPDWWDSD
ncbi:hypothetical protein PG991_010319 [Apiospora marii]|uniref:Uncharacterized protein n=1 Tax=Apiospora marii TaxID=335849 RepID=A0ABR1RI34_9PEZI